MEFELTPYCCYCEKCTYWPYDFDLWFFNPKTTLFLVYLKVIPYTKLQHFGIIRFWVMLRSLVWKITYWPYDLDLWTFNPHTISFPGYLKVIPQTKLEHFGIIRFWVIPRIYRQANKQTDGAEHPTHAARRPTLYIHPIHPFICIRQRGP